MARKRIALAQLPAGPDPAVNLEAGLDMMTEAARRGAAAIVFPELSFTRFFPARRGDAGAFSLAEPIPGPICERVAARAAELGLVTVINLFERAADGAHYDSSPVFDVDGRLLGVSRMQHIAEEPGFHEQEYYGWGPRGAPAVFDTRAGRLGVAVCYDRHYASVMTGLALAGAEVVCVPQAGAVTDPLDAYEIEMRAASFQHGYQVALCNRVGPEETVAFAGRSFLTDPDGGLVARARAGERDLLVADLDPEGVADARRRRPFLRDLRMDLLADLGGRAAGS